MPGKSSVQYLEDSWNQGCRYDDDDLRERCIGNSGALRAAASAIVFFLLAGIASAVKPNSCRGKWLLKYALFLCLLVVTVFIPNKPVFYNIFLQLARIGAGIFIVYQQVILIDMAYNWNESWVEKANQAEDEEAGTGQKWLTAILASCALLLKGSIVVIGLLYYYFGGCSLNIAFITVTLVMSVLVTGVQLCSEEGSLLASSVITAYSTYLLFTALTKNPDEDCNPFAGERNALGTVLGVGLVIVSLAWTGWSVTAATRFEGLESDTDIDDDLSASLLENSVGERNEAEIDDTEDACYTGVVVNDHEDAEESISDEPNKGAMLLNCLLGLVSCWMAMAMTSWGTVQTGGDFAHPNAGRVSMWMIIACQWFASSLYLWTLVAPKLFPDRDFS